MKDLDQSKSQAPNPIKIGQIGICHAHAAERMNSLRRLPEYFEVVGIVDDRHYSNEARNSGDDLKAYQGLKWMSEVELLAVPGLQAVMVETTNLQLVPTALRCVERGVSISMDKPGGNDLALYQKLLSNVESKTLDFQIAYMFRNNPAIQWIKKVVKEGILGDLFEIQASMSHNYGSKKYQKYLSEYSGGILFLLGCHHIDWIVDLLGEPEEVTPFLSQTKNSAHGAKNHAMVILRYPHAMASVHACDSEVGGSLYRGVKIVGTNGTIQLRPIERFDGKAVKLELNLLKEAGGYGKGRQIIDFGVMKDRYADQLIEFAKVLRKEIKNPHSLEHEYLAQLVLQKACGLPVEK